jgi:hypothetical protein
MTRSDRWIGGTFFLFGFLVVFEASKLDFKSSYGAGSGFFPFWLGISTIILGAILTFHALRNTAEASLDSTQVVSWSKKKLLAFSALVAFVFTLELVGFVIGFSFLVACLLRLEGENWRRSLSAALGSGISFYLFFVRLLDVKLPLGPFGF